MSKSNFSFAGVELKKSNKDCEKKCSQTLLVGEQTFYYPHRASLEISTTYNNIEWGLMSLPIKKGKKTITHYYLHNSKTRKKFSTTTMCHDSEREISLKGEVVCFNRLGIKVLGKFVGHKNWLFTLSKSAEVNVIEHHPEGILNFAYISEVDDAEVYKYQLHVNDLASLKKSANSWLTTKTNLHKNSDFTNILAVNSRGDRKFSAAVYEWVNAYNKGLVAYNFADTGLISQGKINASELHNYGFQPQVQMNNQNVIFSAINSSSNQRENFVFSHLEIPRMNYQQHEFDSASEIEFMIGAGFHPSSWHVKQKVEVAGKKKAMTRYDMNTNILTSYYMQGRWKDNQLAVSLLQNKAESKLDEVIGNDLLKEVVREYVIQYDYHGLFSGANTLRLVYGSMNAGGIAHYKLNGDNELSHQFKSKRVIYQALVMAEKGWYWGGYHSKYDSPGMVGFADEYKRFVGVSFDQNLELSKTGLVIGYDEGWYGSRYETDYSRWYTSGEIGVGWVHLDVDRKALFDAVGTETGEIYGDNTIEFRAIFDTGYIWQSRIKSLKGLGMSVQLGYKFQYEYINENPEDAENQDEGWMLNYAREDFLHGPYIKLNVMF